MPVKGILPNEKTRFFSKNFFQMYCIFLSGAGKKGVFLKIDRGFGLITC